MQKQLQCLPLGICSWGYDLNGGHGDRGRVVLAGFGESGTLEINGTRLFVAKPSFLRGEWTVSDGRGELFRAAKSSAFTRRIDITSVDGVYTLEPNSAFTRVMTLAGPGIHCEISPVHAFTRRAMISGRWENFGVVVFAMWLVAMTWRRASNANSSANGAH